MNYFAIALPISHSNGSFHHHPLSLAFAQPPSRSIYKASSFRDVIEGSSQQLIEGMADGLLFADFSLNPSIHTIPFNSDSNGKAQAEKDSDDTHAAEDRESLLHSAERGMNENDCIYAATHPALPQPASQRQHMELVEKIRKFLLSMPYDEARTSKIIAARTDIVSSHLSPPELFDALCRQYPEACVFLFSTPTTGTWIGASPELLLASDDGMIRTMALAGTRPADTDPALSWDLKNIMEQRIVSDFIADIFNGHGLQPSLSEVETYKAGPVEHICTHISAPLPSSFSCGELESLATDLSPTPALAGYPRNEALDFIRRYEPTRRDYYGGFLGIRYGMDTSLFVNLRSCRHISSENSYMLYAGGGITIDSIPEDEWRETERKMTTLRKCLSSTLK